MSTPYIGEIRMFGGNFPPAGWAFCDGQLLPITEYEALFNLIGTTYGGDGEQTFALPDLRGRIPVHQGTSPTGFNRIVGESSGSEHVTLTQNHMPAHTHSFMASSAAAQATSTASGSVIADTGATPAYGTAPATAAMSATSIQPAGAFQPHENMAPYLCVSFIISLFGIFPSPT